MALILSGQPKLRGILTMQVFTAITQRIWIRIYYKSCFICVCLLRPSSYTQELLTDLTAGEKHYVDILAEVKIKGEDGYVLIHIEPQAYREAAFARRMFLYFSRLYEKHQKKVLPVAVFSHGSKTSEPSRHEIAFPFFKVLQFDFYTIQLKQLPWRQYLNSDNPLAAALLSKLDFGPSERVQVKLEFLRLLTRMSIDPARVDNKKVAYSYCLK